MFSIKAQGSAYKFLEIFSISVCNSTFQKRLNSQGHFSEIKNGGEKIQFQQCLLVLQNRFFFFLKALVSCLEITRIKKWKKWDNKEYRKLAPVIVFTFYNLLCTLLGNARLPGSACDPASTDTHLRCGAECTALGGQQFTSPGSFVSSANVPQRRWEYAGGSCFRPCSVLVSCC